MFRALGLLLATSALLVFLYGAMQFARAEEGGGPQINLGDGTVGRLESPARDAGTRALAIAGLLLVGGVATVLVDQGRRSKRRRAAAR